MQTNEDKRKKKHIKNRFTQILPITEKEINWQEIVCICVFPCGMQSIRAANSICRQSIVPTLLSYSNKIHTEMDQLGARLELNVCFYEVDPRSEVGSHSQ